MKHKAHKRQTRNIRRRLKEEGLSDRLLQAVGPAGAVLATPTGPAFAVDELAAHRPITYWPTDRKCHA